MSILDKIKNFFQKKATQKVSTEAAKKVGPQLVARAKKDLVGTAEDLLKDKISEMASEMVNEHIDKNVQLPAKLAHLKDKIVESAVEAAVDQVYDEVKSAILG